MHNASINKTRSADFDKRYNTAMTVNLIDEPLDHFEHKGN